MPLNLTNADCSIVILIDGTICTFVLVQQLQGGFHNFISSTDLLIAKCKVQCHRAATKRTLFPIIIISVRVGGINYNGILTRRKGRNIKANL